MAGTQEHPEQKADDTAWLGEEIVLVARPEDTRRHMAPWATLAIYLATGVTLARRGGYARIADELQELALEVCPEAERAALAADFGITLAETA